MPRAAQGRSARVRVAAPPPGAPPTFGTAPAFGPEVSPATFAEAEKLAQVTMTPAERDMAAGSWRKSLAPLLERRVGPRRVPLDAGARARDRAGTRCTSRRTPVPRATASSAPVATRDRCPGTDDAIAFAPVTRLSRWIEGRKLTSERLTTIYLVGSSGSIPGSAASSR